MADDQGNTEKNAEQDAPKPSPQVQAASRRFQQTQAQVDEVVGIMRTNVEKVLERDTKLSELVSNGAYCLTFRLRAEGATFWAT